jgi:hypothetical protein
MGDPTTSNTGAKFAKRTVQDVLNAAVPVAEAAIIAAAPPMATPVFMQIWEEVFKLVVIELGNALGNDAADIVIDFQVYSQLVSAADAVKNLRAAQAAGDSDAIAKAKAIADAASDALLHYDGDAHS